MQKVKVMIQDGLSQVGEDCWLLLPRPIDDWHQRYMGMVLSDVAEIREVKALNSEQHAFMLKPATDRVPQIEYQFEQGDLQPSAWIWQQQDNRHTRAAEDLVELAHHLKWGVEKLAPGLNPAGGHRVPMSCGRGLRFSTPHGEVEISHFGEPVWIGPDAGKLKPQLLIEIQDSEKGI